MSDRRPAQPIDSSAARWDALGTWWLTELASDPAYQDEVAPLVLELSAPSGRILDVGCGEGRVMAALRSLEADPYGVDIAADLLETAVGNGPVVRVLLPSLECFVDQAFDGAVVSLVLEHIADHRTLLDELARVVRADGVLAMVLNHPLYTAPDSAPIDEPDGEVLWRPGRYFDIGSTDEPAGDGTVTFHHRPLGVLLTEASAAGWDLHRVVESGVTEAQIARQPPLAKQRHIPRLMGVQWVRR